MLEFLQTRQVFVILLCSGLFMMAARRVTDPDVWWHLRAGQLILQTHNVPHEDPYSFTRTGAPWVDHEWLSQVLLYALYRVGGWGAEIVFFGFVIAAALLLTFARSPGKPYIAGIVTILGAVTSLPSWGVRPQMLTFLLTSLLLFLLERTYTRPRLIWWIPPLMLLWVNLHAGYALGIGLVVLFAAGDLFNAIFGALEWSVVLTRLRILGLVAALCLLLVAFNPYGAKLYSYPFETLHSQAMQEYIGEWQSPNFHDGRYLPLLAMILCTLVLPVISPRKLRPRELLLLLVMAYAALRSVRHIPIYVLVAVPLISAALDAWVREKRFAMSLTEPGSVTRPKAAFNIAILVIFAIFLIGQVRYVISHQPAVEASEFPSKAVAFLQKTAPPGSILNHYNWGGYFIWKLYPQYQVFIDGRADVYGDELMNEFSNTYYVKGPHWLDPLERWGIRTAVLPPDSPLVAALQLTSPPWKEVYSDTQAVVLVKLQH